MLKVILLLVLAALSVEAGTSNFTTYFTGGLPFCSQCGTPGQYACSPDASGVSLGNWNAGNIVFTDPVPVGNYATRIVVNVYGAYSCNAVGGRLMFGLSLNSYTHGVRDTSKGVNQCRCDTCDGLESFTFTFTNGVPMYNYRTSNTLKIVPYKDSICVNRVEVIITWDLITGSAPLPEKYFEITIPKTYDRVGCPVCNPVTNQWCSASGNNSLTLSFLDPLPSGVYAISIGVFVSVNMVEKAYLYVSTLAAVLQSTTIGSVSLSETNWKERCGCMSDHLFQSAVYQRGWPAYVYGGANKVTLTVTKYSQTAGNICIGRLGVKIVYYTLEEMEKYGDSLQELGEQKTMIIDGVVVEN